MDELWNQLSKLREEAKGGKYFYPPSEVADLLTFDEIHACIRAISSSQENQRDVARYASLIHQTSIKIFAILLRNEDHAYIKEFLLRRETDSRIPYTEDALDFLPPKVARTFVERQWEFHPVILQRGEIHRNIGEKEILPFLGERKAGKGGFGVVIVVRIYSRCQNLIPANFGTELESDKKVEKEVVIARKELEEGESNDNERAILELVQTLRHPNIVPFLGSYTHHNIHNLLFPYIPLDLKWLLDQMLFIEPHMLYSGMYGVSDALGKIHDFSFKDGTVEISNIGYHHDLRPANILVKDGVLMIADFGLSKMKPDEQDSKTVLRGGDDDYLGPESFNDYTCTNGVVSRALDVWAFGCILTEIASLIERRSVTEFRDRREATHGTRFVQTDHAFHLDGKIRPAVTEYLSDLVDHPTDSQVRELVKLALKLLNPNQHKRIKIYDATPALALLACSSKASAVGKSFDKLSYNNEDRKSNFHVLVLLEQKRFETWKSAFFRLHHEEQLQSIDTVLVTLSHLLTVLSSVSVAVCSTDNELPIANDFLKEISGAIDSASATLPTEALATMQDLWSREVGEIQSIDVLAAIRGARKPERYRSVGIKAAMRYMALAISNSIRAGKPNRYIDSGCVEYDKVSPIFTGTSDLQLIEDKSRVMGFYTGDHGTSRVMIEWKEYDTKWQGTPGQLLQHTMDALVNLLDPQQTPRQGVAKDRVLDCVGYFHEPRNFRFGFLYLLKPNGSLNTANAQLYSLNNVIRMTDPDVTEAMRPDLGDIFHLAKDLASCLHALHDAGWLHKNISSHHVLTFSPSTDTVYQYVASAVLAGFNDSRPEASSYTLGPRQEFVHYQHPLYRRGVLFRRSFDYFGLGVVLLELGLWRPISVLRDDHRDIVSAEDFRKKLLKSYVPQLGERMGKLYRDAVLFCLDAEDFIQSTQEDAEGSHNAQDLFRARVVGPLSQCFA